MTEAVERFVYVIRGEIRLTMPEGIQQLGAGALIVVPAATAITVQAFGPEMGALAEFVPARRSAADAVGPSVNVRQSLSYSPRGE